LDARLLMIGTHPLAEESALTLENMTGHHRYRALNEQVMRVRRGNPLALSIEGFEGLHIDHRDLTFESAATSFQIHLQVPPARAARCFNAALVLSGPMVAAAANSPYLFGKDLWDETRIPLFEQSVNLRPERVTFGKGYVETSLFEIFEENLRDHPVLLPEIMEDNVETMHHLRLHNGTIWRWNRPLIGFGGDGSPHLRIEHRTVPAGPTAADCIANTALCAGMMIDLALGERPPELFLSFDTVRENFYRAARSGLQAKMKWAGGKVHTARDLLLEELVPRARSGLEGLGVTTKDIGTYLGIIEERVGSGQNGAAWQRKRFRRIGGDFGMLVADYYSNQERDAPVHTWEI
ncbi:glutamate--cysteine ligase, partial [Candidatus Moduliflexota bacterium]